MLIAKNALGNICLYCNFVIKYFDMGNFFRDNGHCLRNEEEMRQC